MIVQQSKFGFRKAFVPNDSEGAQRLSRERSQYGRIIVMSLEPLELHDFKSSLSKTGVVWLSPDLESVVSRFRKTVRNEISRTHRDPGLTFKIHTNITDDGYELLHAFMRARGLYFPRDTYEGCMEFLAYLDGKPVSGILLYPSTPVPVIAAIFSKRRYTEDGEEYKRIGFASKRLMYEVCKWGIENGLKGIDLSSLNPDSKDIPGITEYKSSFSPELVDRYSYTYTSPTFAFFESVMMKLRRFQRMIRSYL